MNLFQLLAVGMCCITLSNCQDIAEKEYELRAEIVDDEGSHVPEATVVGARQELREDTKIPLSKNVKVSADSNDDGIALLQFKSLPTPGGVAIHKQGYYSSFYSLSWKPTGNVDSAKREAELKAILKPMKNPIPMHASLMTGKRVIIIPDMLKEYGYDLQMSALVAPYGKGKKADLIIRIDGEYRNENGQDSKIVATIRFGDKEDGVVSFRTPERERGSSFLGDYLAPNTGYVNSLVIPFDSSNKGKMLSRRNDGNYYFRTRTARDQGGSAVQSNYGKIHGDFMLWSIPMVQGGVAQISWIASYFNPTPNDRNVEFDTKRNLDPDGNVWSP